MNIKVKAAAITFGILVSGIILAIAASAIFELIGRAGVVNVIMWSSIGVLLYSMYRLVLTKLEYDHKVDELNKKY